MSESRHIINEKLEDGEKLIWYGAPGDGGAPSRVGRVVLLVFLGFIIGSTLGRISMLLLDLFIAVYFLGLFLYFFGGWLIEWFARKETFYGVTDRRVIIVCGKKVLASNLKDICAVSFAGKKGKGGNVAFATSAADAERLKKVSWTITGPYDVNEFKSIADADKVHDLINSRKAPPGA